MVYHRRRRLAGRGVMDFARNVHGFLKKTGAVSKIGNALSMAGVPYAGQIANVAGKLGYGRRRRYRRRTVGSGLSLAGQGRRGMRRMRALPMMY